MDAPEAVNAKKYHTYTKEDISIIKDEMEQGMKIWTRYENIKDEMNKAWKLDTRIK